MAKKGRLTNEERIQIDQYLEMGWTSVQIAGKLDRTIDIVDSYKKSLPTREQAREENEHIANLHARFFWPQIKKTLSSHEISYYEQQWSSLVHQFQEILATDEIMLQDLIMQSILINRILEENQDAAYELERLRERLDREYDRPQEDRDMVMIERIQSEINIIQAANQTRSKQHNEYQARKDAKLKDLKATRQQRYEREQQKGSNFFDLLKSFEDFKQRREHDRKLALVKLAKDKALKKLMEPLKYEDGKTDIPILNHQSVANLDIEEEKNVTHSQGETGQGSEEQRPDESIGRDSQIN